MRTSWRSVVCFVVLAALVFAPPAARCAEIVVLRGGKTLELSKPYVIRGTQAVLTLKDGTVVSVVASEIDRAATQAARARSVAKKSDDTAEVISPADAARAQKNAPRARLKVGDDDVSHPYVNPDGEGAAKEAGDGEARVEVVDWNQTVSGGSVMVKGNLRNSGSGAAEALSLLVTGKDDKGKTLSSTAANVAAGTLEAGAVTTFTATLTMPGRAASLRFVPTWNSTAAPVKTEGTPRPSATGTATATAAPETRPPKNEAAPPPSAPTYVPRPDFAAPTASAPTSAPDDNHIPYVPNVHEENPPPPPN